MAPFSFSFSKFFPGGIFEKIILKIADITIYIIERMQRSRLTVDRWFETFIGVKP